VSSLDTILDGFSNIVIFTGRLQNVRDGHEYEQNNWFVGQMFEENWKPKNTIECLLPA
jgi:hypothetical protein